MKTLICGSGILRNSRICSVFNAFFIPSLEFMFYCCVSQLYLIFVSSSSRLLCRKIGSLPFTLWLYFEMLAVPRLLPCYSLKRYYSALFASKKRQTILLLFFFQFPHQFILYSCSCSTNPFFFFLHLILNLFEIPSCVERTICHVCVFTLHCQR